MGNPRITDVTTLIAAGFDPKTGLPFKASPDVLSSPLSDNMRKILRITDEQNAINRYKWYNLPSTLDTPLHQSIVSSLGAHNWPTRACLPASRSHDCILVMNAISEMRL